jgi:hypothetical protein
MLKLVIDNTNEPLILDNRPKNKVSSKKNKSKFLSNGDYSLDLPEKDDAEYLSDLKALQKRYWFSTEWF